MDDENVKVRPGSLLRTVVQDIHFWIPLIVLLAGLVFLRELR